jgi:regulator of ribonuclease activity B
VGNSVARGVGGSSNTFIPNRFTMTISVPPLLLMGIFSFLFGDGCSKPTGNQPSPEVETSRAKSLRLNKDRQVIKTLRMAGSDLRKPHKLEHHFVTYDRGKIDGLAADDLAAGYTVSKISTLKDKSGKPYWYFDLIKPVVPKEETIFSESLRMTTLGRRHGIDYDGWGCLVEK